MPFAEPGVVGHAVQLGSPALLYVPAAHGPHTVSFIAVQADVANWPAAQTVQAVQGDSPVPEKVLPAVHPTVGRQESAVVSQ